MDPCAPSRRETFLELIWCGLNCENFGWVLTKTRVSLVFLASLLCLSPMSASSDVEMCSEVCESECVESQHVCGSVHCKQFVQLITQSFSNVSRSVEQKSKLKMSSVSWQG